MKIENCQIRLSNRVCRTLLGKDKLSILSGLRSKAFPGLSVYPGWSLTSRLRSFECSQPPGWGGEGAGRVSEGRSGESSTGTRAQGWQNRTSLELEDNDKPIQCHL